MLLIPPIVRTARLASAKFEPIRIVLVSVDVTASGTLFSFNLFPEIEMVIVMVGLRRFVRADGFFVLNVKFPCPEADGARFTSDWFV